MNRLFFLVLLLFTSLLSAADINPIKITLDSKLATSENVTELINLRRLQLAGLNQECLVAAARAEKKNPQVRGWILYAKLQCAKAEYIKSSKKNADLAQQISVIWSNSSELLFGASSRKLRAEVVNSTILILETDLKTNKKRAWKFIGQLFEAKDWMDSKQKAKVYGFAGELSLAQLNLSAARDYFEKSLIEESSKSLQARYETVLKMIDPKAVVVEPVIEDVTQIESTREELEIYNRMTDALKTGDLIAAAEDGVKLIQDFPGGKRAGVASKEILDIYLSLAAKTDEKFLLLKERVLAEMRKVDGQRQFDWAQTLFMRESYTDAFALAKNSLEQIDGQPISTQVLMLAALSAHNSSDFKQAYEYYNIIVKKHAGTKIAAEALYRLGLLDFRAEKYAEAGARFEKFLQLEHATDFELSSLYWLWRCQQKIAPKTSDQFAQNLISRYPSSYYGLRAMAELNSNKLKLPTSLSKELEWSFNFTENEVDIWQRFLILKKAQWLEEAQLELLALAEPQSAEGKIIFAYLWGEAGDYYRSAELLSRAFAQDASLVVLDTIKISYPLIYLNDIKTEAKKYKIPPELVLALIKQESSFRTNVQSPAGAIGLMQLMPVTAREVARDMRLKTKNINEDLITPTFNIRLGVQYLHRRIRYFEGHVPLALAAYNAGIGNVRGWLKTRADLGSADKLMSSNPINELWIDELPWSETTGYIKSILRNYLIYKTLDQGDFVLSEPVWSITEKE